MCELNDELWAQRLRSLRDENEMLRNHVHRLYTELQATKTVVQDHECLITDLTDLIWSYTDADTEMEDAE